MKLDKLNILANELGNAVAMKMDVADKLSVKNIFKKLEEMDERVDICINNAGIAKVTSIFEPDEQDDFENVCKKCNGDMVCY